MCRRFIAVCLLFCFTPAFANTATSADPPNIVVVLCDDLGYGDLGCYGHPHIKTPNLDSLAANGIRFTDFYSAAAVCSPSRVGLLTGRSPNRAGVYDWIPPGNRPRPDAREQVHMRKDEVTIPQLLKQAGYDTCMSGKWHCNGRFNTRKQPQPGDAGFDHWFGTQNNASPSHENPTNYIRNGKPVGKLEGYSCQIAVDEVIRWLDRPTEETNPFFVYLAFHEPHEPVASPPDLVAKYKDAARTEDEAQYFANVANVDKAVGRLVSHLDKIKVRENTLIIFTSDNGPETLSRYRRANRSYGTPGPLRGMKLHTHEAGFRVAGIMNWKGKIEPGQTISEPVSSLDFLPTFCQLAGVDLPSGRTFDGANFLPVLENKQIERKPLVWCYFNATNEARVAMRAGKYKVLARLPGVKRMQNVTPESMQKLQTVQLNGLEIYDVTTDRGEQNNLADNAELNSKFLAQLQQEYMSLLKGSHVWEPAKMKMKNSNP
jgi:arylsulfatase A